ncbi:Rab-like protein 6 [Mortierella sp. NVP85]|nr:Rab-like protein 6 [Mortierella sp. NVP85]
MMFQKLWKFNSSQTTSPPDEPEDHGVFTKVKPVHASFNKGIPLNNTNDIIKVEVWDVVDKAAQPTNPKASSNPTALKIDNIPTSPTKAKSVELAPHAGFSLDASTIDVYRNTDGVILVYNSSKPWTFDYAVKALSEIPVSMPVLILSNFVDDSSRTALASDRVETLIREHNDFRRKQPNAPANLIRHLYTSMKTGLGLKEIHESLGIPFLNVLRETHRKQFEQKTLEIEKLLKALDGHTQHGQPAVVQQPQQQASIASSRKSLPSTIQTTGPAIHPIPQTSSPTSPARKTRNEHTNVDILSPTPVSAHAPAVLFEFPGKLEEGFFRNIEGTASDHPEGPLPTLSTYKAIRSSHAEIHGNPMVATDEDIEEEEKEENIGDHDVHGYQRYSDDEHGEMAEDSASSTLESIPPLRHTLQDSDLESQPDFPIASAMCYEDAFVQRDDLQLSGKHALHTGGLGDYGSGYEEMAGGHMNNPWESAGDVQGGISESEREEPKEEVSSHAGGVSGVDVVEAGSSREDQDHRHRGNLEDIEEEEEPVEEKAVKKSRRKGKKRK